MNLVFFRLMVIPNSGEDISYSLHFFYSTSIEICIVIIEELLNEGLESLRFCVEACEIKDFTCSSELNVDADVTAKYMEKGVRAGILPCLTRLSMETNLENKPLKSTRTFMQQWSWMNVWGIVVDSQVCRGWSTERFYWQYRKLLLNEQRSGKELHDIRDISLGFEQRKLSIVPRSSLKPHWVSG